MKKFLLLLICLIVPVFGVISGQVLDEKKNPIPEVLVFWEEREITTSTAEDGSFEITDTDQPGFYFLDFRKEGYQSKTATVELAEKQDKSIFVTLKKLKTLRAVQARKRSLQSLTERKGVASTQIDSDTIRKIKLNKTDDLSALSANLFNINTGSSFNSGFTLRGVGSVNTIDPIVGMYIDGIAQFQSYNFPILLGNVDSIEILKGPQMTLYGKNAMAGIIDIKTKIPPNRFSLAASAEIGSGKDLQFGRQTYDLYFTAPLIKDHLYLKGGGYYHDFDGFFFNQYLNKLVGGEENFSTYLRFDHFNQHFDMFFRSKFERLNETSFPYHNTVESANASPYIIEHDKEGKNNKDVIDNYIRFAVPFDYLDLDFNLTYQYLKGDVSLDLDFTRFNTLTLDTALNHHLVTSESKILSSEEGEKYFSWQVGTYAYYQTRDIDTRLFANVNNQTTTIDASDQVMGIALFTSFTIPLVENLYLILGVRGDMDHREALVKKEITATSGNSVDPDKSVNETIWVPTPKVALNYYPIPDILLYLNGARGFRVGGVNFFTSQLANIYYQPEYSWNFDFGMKSKFLIDNRIGSVDMSVFYIYWTDQQVNVYLPQGNNLFEFGIINAGSSQNIGAEIESKIPFYWGFAMGANYGYVFSKYLNLKTKDVNNVEVDASGNFQAFVPQHTFSTFLEHEFKFELLSIRDSIVNRFDLRYISEHYFDVENKFFQSGYFLLNYTFNFSLAGFVWTFWIKNILDERYFAFGLPGEGNTLRVKVGDPISLGGKFAFYF